MDAANRIFGSGCRTSGGTRDGVLHMHGSRWWWLLLGLAVAWRDGFAANTPAPGRRRAAPHATVFTNRHPTRCRVPLRVKENAARPIMETVLPACAGIPVHESLTTGCNSGCLLP
jgi:hypothetical protein